MRRLIVCLVLMCMMALPVDAEELSEHACMLAQRVDVLAKNEDFLKMILASDKMIESAQTMAAGDRSGGCTLIVHVDLNGYIASMIDQMSREVALSDPVVVEEVSRMLSTSVLYSVIAYQGTTTLAVSSTLTTSTMFVCDAEDGAGLYILFYEDAAPVVVSWRACSGAVSMSAMLAPVPELQACTTAQQVSDWLKSIGADGAVVTQVQ